MRTLDPLVSIVLPTMNGSRFISTSIHSVLNQTYQNFELIVVDGGSKDDTLDIISSFSDPRIQIIHQPLNSGRLPGALNLGFRHTSGDFYTWAQDDDYYEKNAIEVMVSFLQNHSDINMVYTNYWRIDGDGRVLGEASMGPTEDLDKRNSIGHCFLYRRQAAKEVGEYDVNYFMAEDVQYWMRMSKLGRIAFIPECYYYHRFHTDSLTIKNHGRHLAARTAARARRNILRIPWSVYQRQLAASYVEEAFDLYGSRDLRSVLFFLGQAVLHNPAWLRNRGVISIGLECLLGSRIMNAYRTKIHAGKLHRKSPVVRQDLK